MMTLSVIERVEVDMKKEGEEEKGEEKKSNVSGGG